MQAHQESLRTQVTVMQTQVARQQKEMQSLMQAQMEKMMQIQVNRQREEVQAMERRLNDKFFSHTEATRPAHSTLPAISSVESDVNECMRSVTEASLRSDPRFDRSFCSLKGSNPPAEIVAFSCADAAASEIGNKTYSTQSPIPRSGYGSWGCKTAAILGSNASSVDTSRPQGQEEPSDVVVTGNAVPSAVPSVVRTSGMHVRVNHHHHHDA